MDIKHTRRILFIGFPDCGVLNLISDLTGSAPAPIDGSVAGLSHVWNLKTNYYSAEIPIWIDEITDIDVWKEEFSKKEAKEVISSLGGWIYCFRRPVTKVDLEAVKKNMQAVEQVIRKAMGYSWDGTCLAVAMPQSTTPFLERNTDEWDDICREFGFEYIDSEAKGRNDYGEPTGLARLKEAIETTDWAADDLADLDDLDEFEDSEEAAGGYNGYDAELAEMDMELKGLKTSLALGSHGDEEDADDQEEQVEEISRMMTRLQAIKDTGAAMPEDERKKFTAKAVNDLVETMK